VQQMCNFVARHLVMLRACKQKQLQQKVSLDFKVEGQSLAEKWGLRRCISINWSTHQSAKCCLRGAGPSARLALPPCCAGQQPLWPSKNAIGGILSFAQAEMRHRCGTPTSSLSPTSCPPLSKWWNGRGKVTVYAVEGPAMHLHYAQNLDMSSFVVRSARFGPPVGT
jgi:hypothetical protein